MAKNLRYPHFFETNLIINPSESLLKSKLISDLKMNGPISENFDDAILRRHGKLNAKSRYFEFHSKFEF